MTTQIRSSLRVLVAASIIALSATTSFAQSMEQASRSGDAGWTGRSVVLGSHSSLSDMASITRDHQTGQY